MTDDAKLPLGRRLVRYGVVFAGAALIGGIMGIASDSDEELFVTDDWSYVPADQWWWHALMLGTTMVAILLAVEIGGLIARWFFRRGLMLIVVGVVLVTAGLVLFGRAVVGDGSADDPWIWVLLGSFIGGLGGLMLWADVAARRSRR